MDFSFSDLNLQLDGLRGTSSVYRQIRVSVPRRRGYCAYHCRIICRCNYSIVLIVSKLRFKYAKLYLTGFTPPILTIQALLKHPFFTVYKYNDYIWIFVSFGVSKFHINLWVSGFFVNFALYDRYNS